MKLYKTAYVIGGFRMPHEGHMHLIDKAKEVADEVAILIGSSYQKLTVRSPFNFEQRKEMLLNMRNYYYFKYQVSIYPLKDVIYSDNLWKKEITNIMSSRGDSTTECCIVGHDKDESSYYIRMLDMPLVEVDNFEGLSSTNLRRDVLHRNPLEKWGCFVSKLIGWLRTKPMAPFSLCSQISMIACSNL